MKNSNLALLLVVVSLCSLKASSPFVGIVKFASLEKAQELLTEEDEFSRSWSRFDINSRMHKTNSTKSELFEMLTKQARAWTEAEENKIRTICTNVSKNLEGQGFNLNLPEEIYFVKTTCREEGAAAGYTRAQFIVLKETLLSQSEEDLEHLVVHELFHILSRHNPEFRKKMYGLIGFKMMNTVSYPESIAGHRITNPDAPQTDSYIAVKANGRKVECLMILYAKEDYKHGEFFDYLNVGFLSLTGDFIKSVEYQGTKPIIYSMAEVDGFYEQVGRNTNYIIHPEEIMAENFSHAVLNKKNLPNPELIEQIKVLLREE